MAGVNMRLKAGAVRELHWHKEAEWSYMLKGKARITAYDKLVAEADSAELERYWRDGRVRRGVGARGGVEQVGLREPLDAARGEDHEGVREEHLHQHPGEDHRRDHDRPGAEERVGDTDHGVTGRGWEAKELGDMDDTRDGRAYRSQR